MMMMTKMFPSKDVTVASNSRIGSPSATLWLYLSAEFLLGLIASVLIWSLKSLKSYLPQPPRDLAGDVVLIAGASSTLGSSLAEEFAKVGCSVICVDNDHEKIEKTIQNLRTRCPQEIVEIGPQHGKETKTSPKDRVSGYQCNLYDRNDIRRIAKTITDDVGNIDVLVTCVGNPCQDIFDTASTTLMSHYWTVLAFLPALLHRERAHVVGVTPVVSTQDAYMGSRAAIAGLMGSLGQEFNNGSGNLTFITVAPKADPRLLKQSEIEIAREVVDAIRRNQSSLTLSWTAKLLYQISCLMYRIIAGVTHWLHAQGCDCTV